MTTAAPGEASPATADAAGRAPARPAARRGRPGRRRASLRMGLEILFFVGPALILFGVFVVWPIARAVQFSLYRWKGFGPLVDFVGLQNYVSVLTNEVFTDAFRHNMTIVVLSILVQLPVGLGIALLLNRRMRFQGMLRTIIFVPYVLSEVIAGVVWLQLLQPEYGVIDTVLGAVGISGPEQGWLGTPEVALYTVFVVLTWKYLGLAVLLFLAGLQGVPDELVEAAQIDGASWWQVQRRVTVPLLGPTIRTWGFLSMIGAHPALRHGVDPHRGRPRELHHHDGDLPHHRGHQALQLRHRHRGLRHPLRGRARPGRALPGLRAAPRRRAGRCRVQEGPMSVPVVAPPTPDAGVAPPPTRVGPLPRRLAAGLVRRPDRRRRHPRPGAVRRARRLPHQRPAGRVAGRAARPLGAGQLPAGADQRHASGGTPLNSTVIAVVTTVVAVVFGLMAAYPLARYRFRWREPIYMVFVLGLLFPVTVAIIPLFIIITRAAAPREHLVGGRPAAGGLRPADDDRHPAAVPHGDPRRARGGRRHGRRLADQVFWRIVVPLSGPGVVTVGVLAFVASWNAYLLPLLLLQGDMKTLPLGVADFSSQYSSDTAGVFAFTTLAMIPALVFFLAMQRRIVSGLQGAVKG